MAKTNKPQDTITLDEAKRRIFSEMGKASGACKRRSKAHYLWLSKLRKDAADRRKQEKA